MFETIKKWFAQVGDDEPSAPSTPSVTYEDFLPPTSSAGVAVTAESAMRVAAVYACVEKLAGGVSTLPVNIYKTDGVDRSLLPRDSLWYLLNEQPHVDFSAASAWENVSVSNSLRGDAFWLIRSDMRGRVVDLLPLPWHNVCPMRMPNGEVRYYVNYPEFDLRTWYPQSAILHFPGLGFDGVRSMSVIKYAARNAAGGALAMDEYSGKFFANGAHPSVILTYPNRLGADQVAELQRAFATKYSGITNAHKIPLILSEGGQAKEISLSAEDAQLLEARKFQVLDIARAFGVPAHMIGESSGSTSWGSGIEAISRGFFQYTLQMRLVRIEQELNRKLFPRSPQFRIEFDRDALLEGDSAAQANYYRAAIGGNGTGIGWMTVDEVRKRKNLSPLGGIASEIFDPRQQQKND